MFAGAPRQGLDNELNIGLGLDSGSHLAKIAVVGYNEFWGSVL